MGAPYIYDISRLRVNVTVTRKANRQSVGTFIRRNALSDVWKDWIPKYLRLAFLCCRVLECVLDISFQTFFVELISNFNSFQDKYPAKKKIPLQAWTGL
jgi:hypothetical protein